MSAKSKVACEFCVSRIRHPHLWTFTLPDSPAPREAARRWSLLQRDLVRSLGFCGVRVFEPHPGGHGLHVHVVSQGRFDVRDVRRLAQSHGFGRIHVVSCVRPEYVAKYLSKSYRQEDWRGIRLWGVIGKSLLSFAPCRVKDVEVSTPGLEILYKLLPELPNLSWRERCYLRIACDFVAAGLCDYHLVTREIMPGSYRHAYKFEPLLPFNLPQVSFGCE